MYTPNDNSANDNNVPNGGAGRDFYSRPPQDAGAQAPEGPQQPARDERAAADARNSYADAGFVRADQAPAVTPRYYYSQGAAHDAPVPKKQKTRSGFGAGKIVALCLVCAIIGGAMGVAGSYVGRGGDGTALYEPAETDSPTSTQAPISTQSPAAAALASGSVLSGSEIYAIGCEQTVGITSEYTTTNIFGQSSSAAVSGSGFVISADGYILTNFHVIETAVAYNLDVNVMLYNGDTYVADIVGYESDNDVAVLKIDASGLSAATIGNSDGMEVGDTVYAIGNPLGELAYSLTSGIVSARDRDISTSSSSSYGAYTTINMFQIDAAVNSGNSGGPVYNNKGEVIGIVTAKYSSTGIEGLGFAIPINDATDIANQLISNGYVGGKAYFGIHVETVSATAAQYYNMVPGAYVYSVDEGSCAEAAGLRVGDIITGLDDYEISSSSDLLAAKKNYRAGDTVSLTISRDGEALTLPLTFDEEVPATGANG